MLDICWNFTANLFLNRLGNMINGEMLFNTYPENVMQKHEQFRKNSDLGKIVSITDTKLYFEEDILSGCYSIVEIK